MRTAPVSVLLAVLLAALDGVLAAPGARAHDPEAVDVHVAGHSPTQLDASRYDVLEEDVTAPDVVIAGVGTLRGTVSRTEQTKRPIYQYLGIPYAEPPVGDLRFVAPVPRKASDEVIDATAFGPACYQFGSVNLRRKREAIPNMVQSEDCLILDVHTPKVDPAAKLPVLVFVHGGTFLTGSSAIKNPQGLLEEDMILVSPQYRLGPLGFLNLNVDEVPGNAGLLDMIEALKWVNRNIERFGGDPTRVTLGGHSAGAASSSLLYLSPLSEGLIRAVMPMSGSALGFWAYDRDPVPSGKTIAALAAQVAGCKEDMIQCLRKVTPQQLNYGYAGYALNALKGGALGMSGITPSVQQAPNAKRVFPADPPETILKDGTVKRALPYMTGVTKHEGTWPLDMAETGYIFPNKLESNSSFLRNDLLHVLLRVIGSDDPAGFVSDSVAQAFLDVDTLGDYAAMRDGLIDTAGAFGFKSPAREFVLRNSDLGEPSFLYAFNHNGASTENSKQGISHGADQPYLFPQPGDDVMTGHDLQVALAYRKLVANFVIYQNPTPSENPVARTPTWGPYSRDSESFLELVWPPQAGQSFSSQLTLARVERFSEGVGATTKVATRSTDPDPVTHSTREADSVTSRTSSATALVPLMTALVLPLILAVRGL